MSRDKITGTDDPEGFEADVNILLKRANKLCEEVESKLASGILTQVAIIEASQLRKQIERMKGLYNADVIVRHRNDRTDQKQSHSS